MTPTIYADAHGRYTVAGWLRQADLCRRDKRPDLVPQCLDQAAARAAEGTRTIADMLLSIKEGVQP